MSKFKIDFVVREDFNRELPPKETELPLEPKAFQSALLDLENEFYQNNGFDADIVIVTALEDVEQTSINPDAEAIKQGDVVWRDWEALNLNLFDGTEKERLQAEDMVKTYKPLWEAGPGYGFLIEFMFGEEEFAKDR